MTERLHFHFSLSCTGEGNGNPLQCSCLENPRDGGAWCAAVYGVAQSRTRLKRRSSSSSSRGILRASLVAPEVNNPPADSGGVGGAGSIPASGRSPGGGHGNPPQYSCVENPMDREVWRATVHGVTQSQTRLTQRRTHGHTVFTHHSGRWNSFPSGSEQGTDAHSCHFYSMLHRASSQCKKARK